MRVVVVGAGMGGLSAALSLATRGAEVTVFERAAHLGGKAQAPRVGGRAIDAGPTVLTMRWVFEELFAAAGESLSDHLTLRPVARLGRHLWKNGASLDLFSDVERSADAIGAFAGPAEARGYRAFQAHARRVLDTVRDPFLRSQRPSPFDLVKATAPLGFSAISRIDAHRTLARALASFFQDPRLRQLFGRYATYCGSSPFQAPATLAVVAEVEREGVFAVEGGMAALPRALARLAEARGVAFCPEREVTEVRTARGAVTGVVTHDGVFTPADAVVVNADAGALAAGALGTEVARAASPPKERSLSAVTWAFVAAPDGSRFAPDTARHTVLFSEDSPAEFQDLWARGTLPRDPTVYLCAQDREPSAEQAPGDAERFFVIINAPANGDRGGPSPGELDACERRVTERLASIGVPLPTPEASGETIVRATPLDFERRFPKTGGALYGAASHGAMSGLSRPQARTKIPGLYLAGGSAHPGPGVPMATLSGQRAAEAILTDFRSTSRSRTGATPGSTSMP